MPQDQNGVITFYVIELYDVVNGKTMVKRRESHHREIVIAGLHPYYEYNVSMAAETVAQGPFSKPLEVRTLEDGTFYYIALYYTVLLALLYIFSSKFSSLKFNGCGTEFKISTFKLASSTTGYTKWNHTELQYFYLYRRYTTMAGIEFQ